MNCQKCNVRITATNWSRHTRLQRHDPDRSIQPRRGRPKTVKLHREIKFHESVFEVPNVRTVVRTTETAFRSQLQTLEIFFMFDRF